jgi:hypothetical protein
MMKLCSVSLALGFVLSGLAQDACACGDKFLVQLDRGSPSTAASLGSAPRQATILVFRPSPSSHTVANSDIALLQQVGHKVQVCDTAGRCAAAANTGWAQVVLVDYRDLGALEIDPAQSKARIVPVVSKASKDDLARLKQRYGAYFDSAAPPGKLLAMVDRLLAQ